jgi:magnesium transporter
MSDRRSNRPLEILRSAIAAGDADTATQSLGVLSTADAVHAISHLSDAEQTELLHLLSTVDAARVVDDMPEDHAARMIERLPSEEAAAIVSEMPSNEQADVISRISQRGASAILNAMPLEDAEDARRLLAYPPDSAGGLMITEFLAYSEHFSVGDVLDDLRRNAQRYRRFDVQYAYVLNAEGALVGVLRLRDLLLSAEVAPLSEVMVDEPLRVRDTDNLEELERFFDRHPLFGVPALNDRGVLVGVVRRFDVEEAAKERASRRFLQFMGIAGGEELRTLPLRTRSLRRLGWLTVNIVLNIIAASVIAMHQDTLTAVISLAVILPIISDMSGCSGSQAMAVSMRELALGFVKPREIWRVLGKEASVGVINGLVLGVLLGIVAWLWQGNWMLGGVVAAALAVNTLVAVCFGGAIPLLLRGMGQDPALASGPLLTTITDMSGFFLVLTLASAALPWLTR